MNSLNLFSILLSGSILLGMTPAIDRDRSGSTNEIIGTMQVEGSKQGMIVGRPETPGDINLVSFKMGTEAPVDPGSIAAKGARQKHLIVVTRKIDGASANLLQAFNGHEVLNSVLIKLTTKKPDSRQMVGRTVKLTKVVIFKIRHDGPDLASAHLEEIAFSFQAILVQNADGSTSTSDDVSANNQ